MAKEVDDLELHLQSNEEDAVDEETQSRRHASTGSSDPSPSVPLHNIPHSSVHPDLVADQIKEHREQAIASSAGSILPVPRYHLPSNRQPCSPISQGKSETIVPLFPWSTNRRATFHSLEFLVSSGLTSIQGQLQCRQCQRVESISIDLQTKYKEVEDFLRPRLEKLHKRAPKEWVSPAAFASCKACKKMKIMKPVVAKKRREINWLFLFLTQSLGVCILQQLKWFCKHSRDHRSGAKDRLLYCVFIAIGRQLNPEGIFKYLPI